MIEVEELSKSFGPVRALDRVSFRVEAGDILGFLGPNGAGKTTAMRILTGFMPGDSGSARVAGHDVRAESLAVRRATGYLPEAVPLYPEMRVTEYLRFRARLKGIPRPQRRGMIQEALERSGVKELQRRVIGTLSRGYRQRVGLADALLARPKVLILDEPTVGLDPEQVREFRQLLREVGRERTVILSTHILSEVEIVCSSVVIIQRGRVVARGTAENLRRKASAAKRVVVEVAGPVEAVRQALASDARVEHVAVESGPDGAGYHRYLVDVLSEDDLRESVYRRVREGGWLLRELTQVELSLEEVFVGLVRKFGAEGEAP